MNQILHCDWLPKQATWSYLARLGLPAVSHKKNVPESHIINPLLTKLVQSTWLDIAVVLTWSKYPVILSSRLINNLYIYLQILIGANLWSIGGQKHI